ncbi:PKD domain-containing protein, partial [Emticicia sp. 17c]|uniref:PKD domain-containing protein n=1 Tax=Emticicia sp. 17c TaxID=3127704 RepID=UPI003FA5E633
DLTICKNTTGTLVATGCTGTVTWNTGATGSTLTVGTAGTYTATCKVTTNGKECSATDSGVLTVNPEVTINVDDLTICKNTTGTLVATGCTGTVTWNTGATGSTLTIGTAGTYTATCKVTANGKECSATDSGVLTVNPEVTINVDDLTICKNTTGTLVATGCTGTVTWNTGATGSTLTIGTAGTYTATCKVTTNGKECSATDSGVLTVNPEVTVNVDDLTICKNTTGTLVATGCSGTVTWNTGATGSTLTIGTAGTYTATCKVTTNGKECSATDSGVLTVNPEVTINVDDLTICKNTTGTLVATGCSGTVTWNTGATGSTLTIGTAGTYTATCKVTANGKECSATDSGVLTVNPEVTI